MAATSTPVGPPLTDHAGEAAALIQGFVGRRNLLPAEALAVAQIHATLAVARATEQQAYAAEAVLTVAEDIRGDLNPRAVLAMSSGRGLRAAERAGYTIVTGSLLPGLWAVDVYRSDDPDHGEGPSSFISFGRPARAMRRGVRLAYRRAEHEQLAQAAPKGLI